MDLITSLPVERLSTLVLLEFKDREKKESEHLTQLINNSAAMRLYVSLGLRISYSQLRGDLSAPPRRLVARTARGSAAEAASFVCCQAFQRFGQARRYKHGHRRGNHMCWCCRDPVWSHPVTLSPALVLTTALRLRSAKVFYGMRWPQEMISSDATVKIRDRFIDGRWRVH